MLDDILTVIWKERKSQFRVRGSRMRFLLMLASPVLLATGIGKPRYRRWSSPRSRR